MDKFDLTSYFRKQYLNEDDQAEDTKDMFDEDFESMASILASKIGSELEGKKDEINEITNNNPSQLLGWQSVQLVLGAGNQTAYSEEKASGVSGVVEIADQQLQEMAKKQEKNNQDINKYLPYIGTAAILIYLFGRSK